MAAYGGRYLTRGGATEVLEGAWSPRRCVILEFPNLAQAKRTEGVVNMGAIGKTQDFAHQLG